MGPRALSLICFLAKNRITTLKNMAVILLFLSSFSFSDQETEALSIRLDQCALINDSVVRLQCFDDLVNTSKSSRLTQAVPPVVSTKKSEVGEKYLKNPSGKNDQTKSVIFTLVETREDSSGRWVFYFENGQVWRQLEGRYVKIPTLKPISATLSSGVFGSYSLRIGRQGKSIKVKRVK